MAWIIITWILVGLITFVIVGVAEYRGKEYRECNFEDFGKVFILSFVLGYVMPILAIATFVDWNDFEETIYRLIYKIFNVGLKEKGEEHE